MNLWFASKFILKFPTPPIQEKLTFFFHKGSSELSVIMFMVQGNEEGGKN